MTKSPPKKGKLAMQDFEMVPFEILNAIQADLRGAGLRLWLRFSAGQRQTFVSRVRNKSATIAQVQEIVELLAGQEAEVPYTR